MGIHSPSSLRRANKLWNVLKVTLILMARKGLISKRRFIMDIHLMIKRGKLFRKSVINYFTFHSTSTDTARGSFSIQDYEFSCANTPIHPVFSHMPNLTSTKYHSYFPCINLPVPQKKTAKAFILLPATPEHYLQCNASSTYTLSPGFGTEGNPLVSPFAVRISNYSSEEEVNESNSDNGQVDTQAEEFIKKFYEQLKMQRRLQ